MTYRLAHLSDLHLGAGRDAVAEQLVEALVRSAPDRIAVTGDITHRGKRIELESFRRIFAPVAEKLACVPGNHDRLGDDVEESLMPGPRVQVLDDPGVRLVRVNSTGPHNRRWFHSHGLLTRDDLDAVERALRVPPARTAKVILLHHHPLPLPEEDLLERFATRLGWPNASELPLGSELVQRLRGLCDLVLHGHRHIPAERLRWRSDSRPLRIVNGGRSTLLRGFRLFEIDGARWSERWVDATEPREAADWWPVPEYLPGSVTG